MVVDSRVVLSMHAPTSVFRRFSITLNLEIETTIRSGTKLILRQAIAGIRLASAQAPDTLSSPMGFSGGSYVPKIR